MNLYKFTYISLFKMMPNQNQKMTKKKKNTKESKRKKNMSNVG